MFGDLSASRVMIDANVLIFAMRESRAGDGKETRDRTAAARQFIRAQEVVRISSIALAEVLRKLTDKEREFLNDPKHGLTNLYAEAFTDKMARFAADLVGLRCPPESFCTNCLNMHSKNGQKPCGTCNRVISPHKRLEDSFVVATAAITKNIDRLLTADTGVIEFRNALKNPAFQKRWPDVAPLTIDFLQLDNGPLYSTGERDDAEKPGESVATVQESSSGTKPK